MYVSYRYDIILLVKVTSRFVQISRLSDGVGKLFINLSVRSSCPTTYPSKDRGEKGTARKPWFPAKPRQAKLNQARTNEAESGQARTSQAWLS